MSSGKEKNMRQVRWASWMVGLAMGLAVCGVRPAVADIRSDQAAAILEWPSVLFYSEDNVFDTGETLDTVIQLSNTSADRVFVHCFYENANSHCTNTGEVCVEPQDCCDSETGCGTCKAGWNETDFRVQITPFQPLGWLASEGVSGFDISSKPPKDFGTFAIDGVHNFGPDGISSNAGSRIPPVPEDPFNGSLRCIAVTEDGVPVDRNVLKGEATITLFEPNNVREETPMRTRDIISVAKHNAIGIQAIPGANNGDSVLVLGAPDNPDAEYNGCPNVLILNHFFDFAINPVVENFVGDSGDEGETQTLLTLVPCTQDFLRQIPGAATVQYLVYNEFEQRFSTSRPFDCKQTILISNIDTTQNHRSIFSAGVAGTLTGQTRINPIGSGVLGVATEITQVDEDSDDVPALADFNLHYQGDRADPDTITLP